MCFQWKEKTVPDTLAARIATRSFCTGSSIWSMTFRQADIITHTIYICYCLPVCQSCRLYGCLHAVRSLGVLHYRLAVDRIPQSVLQ